MLITISLTAIIVGIDAGAGIMEITGKAIEEYNLNYTLQSSSEAGYAFNS